MPLANNFTFRTSMQEPGSNYSIHVCPSSLQQVLSSSRDWPQGLGVQGAT